MPLSEHLSPLSSCTLSHTLICERRTYAANIQQQGHSTYTYKHHCPTLYALVSDRRGQQKSTCGDPKVFLPFKETQSTKTTQHNKLQYNAPEKKTKHDRNFVESRTGDRCAFWTHLSPLSSCTRSHTLICERRTDAANIQQQGHSTYTYKHHCPTLYALVSDRRGQKKSTCGDAMASTGVYACFFWIRSRRSLIWMRLGGFRSRWLRNTAMT